MKAWWALFLLPAGCRAAPHAVSVAARPPVPLNFRAGDETQLWPLTDGADWVYEVERTIGPRTYTFECRMHAEKVEQGAYRIARIRREKGEDSEESSATFLNSTTGLTQLKDGDEAVAPPRTIVPFPLRFGQKVAQKLIAPAPDEPKPLSQEVETQVREREVADTVLGRYEAVAVESVARFSGVNGATTSTSVSYWVPRLGPVRFVNELRAQESLLWREVWSLKRQTIARP